LLASRAPTAEAQFEALGAALAPPDSDVHQETVEKLRVQLGSEFTAAWSAGRQFAPADAVSLSLGAISGVDAT